MDHRQPLHSRIHCTLTELALRPLALLSSQFLVSLHESARRNCRFFICVQWRNLQSSAN